MKDNRSVFSEWMRAKGLSCKFATSFMSRGITCVARTDTPIYHATANEIVLGQSIGLGSGGKLVYVIGEADNKYAIALYVAKIAANYQNAIEWNEVTWQMTACNTIEYAQKLAENEFRMASYLEITEDNWQVPITRTPEGEMHYKQGFQHVCIHRLRNGFVDDAQVDVAFDCMARMLGEQFKDIPLDKDTFGRWVVGQRVLYEITQG